MQPLSPPAEPASVGAELSCDVLVIGGGPAGSTIAALLAERGRDVVVLEKAHHPRFHIGESLLPANVPLFERLGVREQVEAIGMRKCGVEFVSPEHEQRQFSSSPTPGTSRCRTPGRCAAPSSTRCCSATPAAAARASTRARACARSRSTTTARPSHVELDDGAGAAGARASSSTPRAATRCSPTSSRSRRRTGATTARRCSATSPAPSGCPASSRATSPSSGSSTAGSGSSRWRTARPASAPCAGRTT